MGPAAATAGADGTQAAPSPPSPPPAPPLSPHRWAQRCVHARGCSRPGFAIALEGHARLPLPAPVLFELLTHPDNAGGARAGRGLCRLGAVPPLHLRLQHLGCKTGTWPPFSTHLLYTSVPSVANAPLQTLSVHPPAALLKPVNLPLLLPSTAILRSLDRCTFRHVLSDDGEGRLTAAVEQETSEWARWVLGSRGSTLI